MVRPALPARTLAMVTAAPPPGRSMVGDPTIVIVPPVKEYPAVLTMMSLTLTPAAATVTAPPAAPPKTAASEALLVDHIALALPLNQLALLEASHAPAPPPFCPA